MAEARRRPVEGVIQGDVHGRGGHPFRAADDMGNVHKMVIHHVSKVIRWVSVGLDQDRIIPDALDHIQFAFGAVLSCLTVD